VPGRHRHKSTTLRNSLVATALAATGAAGSGIAAAATFPDPEPSESAGAPVAVGAATHGHAPTREHAPPRTRRCQASFYGGKVQGGLTAAHRTLPMGSRVRVTNPLNDRSVLVRIDDRGPFIPGRCLDLSEAAMRAIHGVGSGVIPVKYEVLRA
jgi:rare lipoprotein A